MAEKKIDFSKEAISGEVRKLILSHPAAWIPLTLGVIGASAVALELSGAPVLYAALGCVGVAAGAWAVNFGRRDALESKIIHRLTRQLETEKVQLLEKLKAKLHSFSKIADMKEYAEQADQQFALVRTKYERFRDMLGEKLDPTELIYGRFLGTVEQLYLSVLDNLETIVHFLESMQSIDVSYIEDRMKHLKSMKSLEPADQREVQTLRERADLREKSRIRVNELLTINEEAMTQIDRSISAIAEAKTVAGRASVDMEFAREELVKLIDRMKKNSTGGATNG